MYGEKIIKEKLWKKIDDNNYKRWINNQKAGNVRVIPSGCAPMANTSLLAMTSKTCTIYLTVLLREEVEYFWTIIISRILWILCTCCYMEFSNTCMWHIIHCHSNFLFSIFCQTGFLLANLGRKTLFLFFFKIGIGMPLDANKSGKDGKESGSKQRFCGYKGPLDQYLN